MGLRTVANYIEDTREILSSIIRELWTQALDAPYSFPLVFIMITNQFLAKTHITAGMPKLGGRDGTRSSETGLQTKPRQVEYNTVIQTCRDFNGVRNSVFRSRDRRIRFCTLTKLC